MVATAGIDISRPEAPDEDGIVSLGAGSVKDSGAYMYWRKGSDGYIRIGPAWNVEYLRQIEKGDTPLRAYGKFQDNPRVWNIWQDPFRHLLQHGGAKEFCVAQILELGWHRKSPLPGVTFPQLAESDHQDVKCSFCGKPYLNTADLHRHESVAHKESAETQGLARALAQAIQENGASGSPMAQMLGMFMKGFESLAAKQSEQDARMEQQAALMTQQSQVLAALLDRLTPPQEAPSPKK